MVFIGLGTIINTVAVLVGGTIGIFCKKAIPERIKNALLACIGTITVTIGLMGAIDNHQALQSDNGFLSGGTLVLLCCLMIGTFIGELINIDKGMERFGDWLKKKSKSEKDENFLNAFLTASFTVCIGAMAIMGSINDGMQINGGCSLLIVKSVLDFVFVLVMSSTMGKGCLFSAVPTFLLQGFVTVLAYFLGDILPENSKTYLSLVGNVIIVCVGINILFDKKIRVANMTPALLFAIACGYFL